MQKSRLYQNLGKNLHPLVRFIWLIWTETCEGPNPKAHSASTWIGGDIFSSVTKSLSACTFGLICDDFENYFCQHLKYRVEELQE